MRSERDDEQPIAAPREQLERVDQRARLRVSGRTGRGGSARAWRSTNASGSPMSFAFVKSTTRSPREGHASADSKRSSPCPNAAVVSMSAHAISSRSAGPSAKPRSTPSSKRVKTRSPSGACARCAGPAWRPVARSGDRRARRARPRRARRRPRRRRRSARARRPCRPVAHSRRACTATFRPMPPAWSRRDRRSGRRRSRRRRRCSRACARGSARRAP